MAMEVYKNSGLFQTKVFYEIILEQHSHQPHRNTRINCAWTNFLSNQQKQRGCSLLNPVLDSCSSVLGFLIPHYGKPLKS